MRVTNDNVLSTHDATLTVVMVAASPEGKNKNQPDRPRGSDLRVYLLNFKKPTK